MQTGTDEMALSQDQLSVLLSGVAEDVNRRNKDRRTFPCKMTITPIKVNGRVVHDNVLPVTGKDISETGVRFVHAQPVPERRGVLSFSHSKLGKFSVEVMILWTEVNAAGVYESGCRMIRKAADHDIRA